MRYFFAPHADQFGLSNKLDRLNRAVTPNPFIDPQGWRQLLTHAESIYVRQLEAENAAGTVERKNR